MAESFEIRLASALYSSDTVFRTVYKFTGRCHCKVETDGPDTVLVSLSPKEAQCDLAEIAKDFHNELIDQRTRSNIAQETAHIRDLIVAQAFGEARFGE